MKIRIRPDALLNSISGTLLGTLLLLTICIPLFKHAEWLFDIIIVLPITAACCLALSAVALFMNAKNKMSWLIAISSFTILAFYAWFVSNF